jgi:DNA-binding response OmpR family regulator
MAKLLIIEDDARLASVLRNILNDAGHQAEAIKNFDDTVAAILQSGADLVLLDLNIPNLNGNQVLRQVREKSALPIIVLTSLDGEINEVLNMSYGADDFVRKPYSPQVLLLRIEAVLKRAGGAPNDSYTYKNLELLPDKNTVRTNDKENGKELVLSKNEFAILSFLVKNHGKIISRADLMDYLWDDDRFVDDNTLTVNINRLRQKLAELDLQNLISTRRGQGYILE